MTARSESNEQKEAVSVAEMARLVGLSRARFYQLVGPTFPYPVYDLRTRRPLYTAEMQAVCMDVRRRNCGIDGRPVLFYAARAAPAVRRPRPERPQPATAGDRTEGHSDLIAAVRGLGMGSATAGQVAAAVRACFPGGVAGVAEGERIRRVFLQLRRQDSADNVRR